MSSDRLAGFDKFRLGFFQKAARAFVRFLTIDCFVKGREIQVMRPGRHRERHRAIICQFIQSTVPANMNTLEVKARNQRSRKRNCSRQVQQPASRRKWPIPSPAEK